MHWVRWQITARPCVISSPLEPDTSPALQLGVIERPTFAAGRHTSPRSVQSVSRCSGRRITMASIAHGVARSVNGGQSSAGRHGNLTRRRPARNQIRLPTFHLDAASRAELAEFLKTVRDDPGQAQMAGCATSPGPGEKYCPVD